MYDNTIKRIRGVRMVHNEELQKQNQLITLCFLAFFLCYITLASFEVYTYNKYFISGSGLFFALIYLLMNVKVSPKIIQLCIVIFLNVLILLLILNSFYLLNIYWLIFYLILIGMYRSLKLLAATSAIVSVEILLLILLNTNLSTNSQTDTCILITITISSLLIGLIQTVFIQMDAKKQQVKMHNEIKKAMSKQAYLEMFFEYANDAIAVFDLDNKIMEINPAFEKLYGWKKEECIGQSIPLVPPHKVKESRKRFEELKKGESFIIESDEMKKDGTIFKAQISLSPIYDEAERLLALSVISRDISYLKEHERLKMQSEKLKLAGEIAAGVAHEIRNPMTVISSFVQMMQADQDSPFKSYVGLVQDEIERIDLIISEFLVLSKPQMKDKERLNLVEIIDNISAFYQLEFQAKSISFEFSKEIEEAYIDGNKNELKQVFINLFKNAMEAIEFNGFIKISIAQQDDQFVIIIQDNGCGIKEEILERIFEPFYTTKTKGTGLGMMITHKIVQDHQGSMKVYSREHIGTDIHIKFKTFS